MTTCIYAGSFDPFTLGHFEVVEEALRVFDQVYIVIAKNAAKKTLLTADVRKQIITAVMREHSQVQVVILENTLLAEFAARQGITHLVRGVRNSADWQYEHDLATVNANLSRNLHTIFVPTPSYLTAVSSSVVRSMIGLVNWPYAIRSYLPTESWRLVIQEVLHDRWHSSGEKEQTFEFLTTQYTWENDYHNLAHIATALAELDWYRNFSEDANHHLPVEYAIWFHDAVYVPGNDDNEELSAALIEYRVNAPRRIVDIARNLILATKVGYVAKDVQEKLIHDIDFATMGAAPSIYNHIQTMIKSEFTRVIDRGYYAKGRREFLNGLQRDGIYYLQEFKDKYAAQATHNIMQELALYL